MNPVTLLTSLVCKERFQLLCAPVEVNMKKTHNILVKSSNPGGGGGGTLTFSSYVGSAPASAINPPKISGIPSTQKEYLKF